MTEQSAVRLVLEMFRNRGWRDEAGAATAVVRELRAGGDIRSAIAGLPDAFLAKNSTSRPLVHAALEPLADAINKGVVRTRVVVLTAIEEEYKSVASHLTLTDEFRSSTGTRYSVGTLAGNHMEFDVYLGEIGPGNAAAAATTATALSEIQPQMVLFVGVAGGIKSDAVQGSVVVAESVHMYESGKHTEDAFLARPKSFPTANAIVQLAKTVRRGSDFPVLVKPIVAGESLVTSSRSAAAEIARTHYNDAVAVDMESGGVYVAAFQQRTTVVSVRGISDQLDNKSESNDAEWQPRAAANAAVFAVALLVHAQPEDIGVEAR